MKNKIKNLWQNFAKLKQTKNQLKLALMFIGLITSITYAEVATKQFADWLIQPNNQVTVFAKVPKVKAIEKELPMREWIKNEVEKAGLSWEEVDCLIQNESAWKQWNNNWNTNGTVDSGLFMINSCHKNTISLKDRYDYKTATKWAINKRKRDGGYCAWVAAKKCGLCN